jgi:hypothetical protein
MLRIAVLGAVFATLVGNTALAQNKPEYGDDVFQPQMGQAGKDVIGSPRPTRW